MGTAQGWMGTEQHGHSTGMDTQQRWMDSTGMDAVQGWRQCRAGDSAGMAQHRMGTA